MTPREGRAALLHEGGAADMEEAGPIQRVGQAGRLRLAGVDASDLEPSPTVRAIKRILDVALASAGIVIAAPFVGLVALLIRLDSPGPVFYSQERVGQDRRRRRRPTANDRRHRDLGGRPFTIYKLRTMREDAESATGPVWAQKGDARVTRLGKYLRLSRFDELPQLWNVLRGEMSLVGPRPERPHFVVQLAQNVPGYRLRLAAAKPGLTGLAQVFWNYDTSVEGVRVKVAYDLAYGESLGSLATYLPMELRILARTVLVVLTGRGAQ